MEIKLQEIEFGVADIEKSKEFYQNIFGLKNVVDIVGLKVFPMASANVDFNLSTHHGPKEISISFLVDDFAPIISKLEEYQIPFEGPMPSHLGMTCIKFKDPDNFLIRVNRQS